MYVEPCVVSIATDGWLHFGLISVAVSLGLPAWEVHAIMDSLASHHANV